jgi:non-canonical purine NTP pyrophosphatase (RdgB/HAM1 family)
MSFTLVSGNLDKVRVVESVLGHPIEHVEIDLDEIQELDQEKISAHKARQAWELVRKPLVVWDMAVHIDCLNGFPGPLIKWFWQQVGLERICEIARQMNDNRITVVSYLTYIDESRLVHFTGQIRGTIPSSPRGEGGFGWDAIFVEDGYDKTSAELKETDRTYHLIRNEVFQQLELFLQSL